MDCVECGEPHWNNPVSAIGEEFSGKRRLEQHVSRREDEDPRRGVPLVLVVVEQQK